MGSSSLIEGAGESDLELQPRVNSAAQYHGHDDSRPSGAVMHPASEAPACSRCDSRMALESLQTSHLVLFDGYVAAGVRQSCQKSRGCSKQRKQTRVKMDGSH